MEAEGGPAIHKQRVSPRAHRHRVAVEVGQEGEDAVALHLPAGATIGREAAVSGKTRPSSPAADRHSTAALYGEPAWRHIRPERKIAQGPRCAVKVASRRPLIMT